LLRRFASVHISPAGKIKLRKAHGRAFVRKCLADKDLPFWGHIPGDVCAKIE
jgi:hypothetical protein